MHSETVSDRVAHVQDGLTARELAVGMLLVTMLGAALLVVQQPLVHDALHNARHVGGIVCH